MSPIPFYYIWTPRYECFHKLLSDSLLPYSTLLEPKPIFLTQEEFQATLSSSSGAYTSWFLKIDCILEALHKLPEDSYFIFSDADVYLFPNRPIQELLNLYTKSKIDLVGMQESRSDPYLNFGFILLRVCDATRALFINTKRLNQETPGKSDQDLVNLALKTFTGTYGFFPPCFVSTMSTIEDMLETSICLSKSLSTIHIFQPLPHGDLPSREKLIAKLTQYYSIGVPIENYQEYFPDSIQLQDCLSGGRNFEHVFQ
jgi:hypothetical protein